MFSGVAAAGIQEGGTAWYLAVVQSPPLLALHGRC